VEIGGKTHTLRRVLVEDIDQSGKCSSSLSIDGKPAQDVSHCGIGLASPPFESPVLMQHSLRYVLATNPQSRTDYLKAVLDIADLDEVRRIIASEVNALRPPTCPSLEKWQAAQRHPTYGSSLERADLNSDANLNQCLADALRQVVVGPPPAAQVPDLARAMEAEIEHRQRAVFPIGAFEVQPPPIPSWPQYDALQALVTSASAQRGAGSPAVLELLQAVVRQPQLPTPEHPLDCPVCLTRAALTERRVEEIRHFLSQREKEQAALEGAKAEIVSAGATGKRVREYISSGLPRALAWSEAARMEHSKAAALLLPGDGDALLQDLLNTAAKLAESWNSATRPLDEASLALKTVQEGVRAGLAVDLEALRRATGRVTEAMTILRDTVAEYVTATATPLSKLQEAVEKQSNTTGWRELLQLCECYARIPHELQNRRAFTQFEKEVQAALKQIDKARGAVLDANFETLSDEVVKWWNLLRPNEPVRFSGLRRRGSGLRFVDLKALLGSETSGNDVERDAAGVFSDSQLNALGLAVFLARANRDGKGLVVLDDPVPASDQEHRATFSHRVLGQLIADAAVQTIVTTHDRELNKRIHDLHGHAGIDGYEVAMDPAGGTVLISKSDDLLSLLGDADVKVRYCLDTQLGEASEGVRKAAERLAKDIIVLHRRQAGAEISVADIDESLGELTKMATPFLTKDTSHAGKLKHAATVLNPGSHDDHRTPARQDLVVVMGDLKFLRKTYCKRRSAPVES
jgi:hypothetical protein